MAPVAKKVNPEAYSALVDALAAIYHNKRPFERFLRLHLQSHPELLAGLVFADPNTTKREVADELIIRLARDESQYQPVTLALMTAVADFADFSNLRQQEDGSQKLAVAESAQITLRKWVQNYSEVTKARERVEAETTAAAKAQEERRSFDIKLQELRDKFLELHASVDFQKRGILLETLLNELFVLYDLSPRGAFRLRHEQIDGAFTYNTDDFIMEAKWEKAPIQPLELHVLKAKVDARAKNVLGLFFAVNGFTAGAVDAYRHGTALILMHGTDLFAVLDGRIDLRDLLERKRRHASETGSPLLSVSEILAT